METGNSIINLDACGYSDRHGTYGGQAGLKDGVIYEEKNWLVKYPRNTRSMDVEGLSYTTAPLSEYVGSHIYQILGYDTHETMLAVRNGKLAVACKDFRADDEMLVEIRTIKNAANNQLAERLDRDFSETGSQHMVNLDELLLHLAHNDILRAVDGLKERFWECVIIDVLINNNDRNNGNWGIIRKKGIPDKLAPVFDNGACFSNKMSEARVSKLLQNDDAVRSSALNTVSGFERNGKMLHSREIINMDIPDLKNAVLRTVPKIKSHMKQIREFIRQIPEKHQEIVVCSRGRGEFYIKCMECRMQFLLEPCYEKCKSEMSTFTPLK